MIDRNAAIRRAPARRPGRGYDGLTLSREELPTDGELEVSCAVANAGARRGTETVQLYLGDPVAEVTRPLLQLAGFHRVELGAGERGVRPLASSWVSSAVGGVAAMLHCRAGSHSRCPGGGRALACTPALDLAGRGWWAAHVEANRVRDESPLGEMPAAVPSVSAPSGADAVLALQRAAGNRATARLITGGHIARMTGPQYDTAFSFGEKQQVERLLDALFAARYGLEDPDPARRAEEVHRRTTTEERDRLRFRLLIAPYSKTQLRVLLQHFDRYAKADLGWNPARTASEELSLQAEVELRLTSSPIIPQRIKDRLEFGASVLDDKIKIRGVVGFGCEWLKEARRFDPGYGRAEAGEEGVAIMIATRNSLMGNVALTPGRSQPYVVLRAGIADVHAGVHEALHFLAGGGWQPSNWPAEHRDLHFLAEGMTELLARAVMAPDRPVEKAYERQVERTRELIGKMGLDAAGSADLYFRNVHAFLERADVLNWHPELAGKAGAVGSVLGFRGALLGAEGAESGADATLRAAAASQRARTRLA